MIDISKDSLDYIQIRNGKRRSVMVHKQVERKDGMLFMRLKSRTIY